MDPALGELVVAGDVVEVGVAGDGDQRLLGDERDVLAQADHAPAAVDQQVAVAAAHMPEVAAVEFLDERLVDPGHAVAEVAHAVPGRRPVDAAHRAQRRVEQQARARRRRPGRRVTREQPEASSSNASG